MLHPKRVDFPPSTIKKVEDSGSKHLLTLRSVIFSLSIPLLALIKRLVSCCVWPICDSMQQLAFHSCSLPTWVKVDKNSCTCTGYLCNEK